MHDKPPLSKPDAVNKMPVNFFTNLYFDIFALNDCCKAAALNFLTEGSVKKQYLRIFKRWDD